MASPQIENGFTKIANELYDAIIRWHFSSYEYRVLIFLIRKTYGWNKKEDWISLSQFVKATNIQESHVSRALQMLIQQNIVTKGGKRNRPLWRIQKDYEQWIMLPKGVRSHHKLKKGVIQDVKGGNSGCKRGGTQKTTITKDTITKLDTNVSRGNPDINALMDEIKKVFNLPILDGSVEVNRRYAWLALKKFGGIEGVRTVMAAAKASDFWEHKISGFKTLYYHGVKIVASMREKKKGLIVIS